MARTTSYGLGQYRFNRNYSYINQLNSNDLTPDGNHQADIEYCDRTDSGTKYQDIKITLPKIKNTPVVQYGQTYYVELTLPQNQEYTTIIDLKLCAAKNGNIDFSRFQNIKRIIIPPTPAQDSIYSPVLLFENPHNSNEILAAIVKDYADNAIPDQRIVYKEETTNNTIYYYCPLNGPVKENKNIIKNKNLSMSPQTWNFNNGSVATITYKFAFSPKFNLEGGYPYLLIETSRENSWSHTMQRIDSKGNTYYGTVLNISKITFKLYSVSNLLQNGSSGVSQIQSGTGQLTHIGIWGHPELTFTINGEEIKIGQSGYYELNDFVITSLGVIVVDTDVDRFTIDYEYKIVK